MNNSFTFKDGWGAEVSGWYQGKQVSGTIIANPMGQINFGGSKQLFKGAGTLRLNLQDPFNLGHFSGYSRYGNVDVKLVNHWDNRVVNAELYLPLREEPAEYPPAPTVQQCGRRAA